MAPEEKKPCCDSSENKSSCSCSTPGSTSSCGSSAGGADCCAPAVGSASRWKTLLFALVLGAAVAVLIHGLVKRPAKSAQASEGSFATLVQSSGAAPSSRCGSLLASVASLDSVAADKEAVFIFLPGNSPEGDQKASVEVHAAIQKLSARGKRVAAFTLESSVQDHGRLVQRFSIGSLPGVVVAGRGCGSTAVWGEINEAKLLQAFVAASAPPSSCGPSGCGPSGCQ